MWLNFLKNRYALRRILIVGLSVLLVMLLIIMLRGNNVTNILSDRWIRRPFLSEAEFAARVQLMVNNVSKRHVLLDLGANKGDSIYNFLGMNKAALSNNKIDQLIDRDLIDAHNWIIYAIEANHVFDASLAEMRYQVEKQGHLVFLFNQTVAWTYNGFIDFYYDTINAKNDFWGSSVFKEAPDVVHSGHIKQKLVCKDIAKLIKSYKVDDTIVVKMDVEGAEYVILLDFLLKDAVKLIDYIAVEYHHKLSPFTSPESVFHSLFNTSKIKFLKWN